MGMPGGRKKGMGLGSAVSIGVGGMIGAGIFSVLGVAAQIAGSAVFISFMLAGVVALLSTYSYAKLGARFPSAGGPTRFLEEGFGHGTLSGGLNMLLWVGYVFALALYARAFASYAMTFLPQDAPDIWLHAFITGIMLLFVGVNFLGARAVGESESIIVLVKVGILVAFSAAGMVFIQPSNLSVEQWEGPFSVLFAAGIIFIGYEGFGLITNAAGDMDEPARTLPRALYSSVLIVMTIYVLVSLVVIGNLAVPDIVAAEDYALAEAARPAFGLLGFRIMAVAALFSTASAINATLYGGSNVSYMLAKEGELPRAFARKVWHQSREGLFITAFLVIIIANLLDLGGISMLGSATFLLLYGMVSVAHLNLLDETGANRHIVWLAAISCFGALGILACYEILNDPLTLALTVCVIILAFATEHFFMRGMRRSRPGR